MGWDNGVLLSHQLSEGFSGTHVTVRPSPIWKGLVIHNTTPLRRNITHPPQLQPSPLFYTPPTCTPSPRERVPYSVVKSSLKWLLHSNQTIFSISIPTHHTLDPLRGWVCVLFWVLMQASTYPNCRSEAVTECISLPISGAIATQSRQARSCKYAMGFMNTTRYPIGPQPSLTWSAQEKATYSLQKLNWRCIYKNPFIQ